MNFKHLIYGIIIGIANIIPGVSGGTMAVILNVYDQIIHAVSNLTKDMMASIKFLLPIGLGAGIGIVLFSKVIEYSLEHYYSITNMAFVGLIVGSIPMIYKSISKSKKMLSSNISFIVTLMIMFLTNAISPTENTATLITTLDVSNFIILFLASVVAAAAMIIPGISGSFMMLIFGTYSSVLNAISNFNIPVLIPVALGCSVGILGCAKIIEKLFHSYPQQTYAGILGFMIGSIFVILPPITADITGIIGVCMAIFTSFVAYMFSKK